MNRLAELQAMGWKIIRISRDMLRYRPDVVIRRVRDALRDAGWPHWGEIRLDARISLERVA